MFIGHWSKYNTSVFSIHIYIYHTVLTQGWRKVNLYVIPVTSQGCFGVGMCCDLGMIQAMIDITSEHNVSKNNKNELFF